MDNAEYVTRFRGCEIGEDILHDDYTITSLTFGSENHTVVTIANNSSISVSDQIRYTFCLKQDQTGLYIPIRVKVNFTDQLGRLILETDIQLGHSVLPPRGATHMDFVVEGCPEEYAANLQIKAVLAIAEIPEPAYSSGLSLEDALRLADTLRNAGLLHPTSPQHGTKLSTTLKKMARLYSDDDEEPSKKAIRNLKKFLGGE